MNGKAKDDAIRAVLDELARGGSLTPQAVVDAARSPESPLHECFEWNDKKAAARFRIVQARRLIARLEVTVIEESRILIAPFAVRDPALTTHQQGYARTVDLQTDQDRARMAIRNEVARVGALLSRVRALAAAFGMEGEVEHLQAEVEHLSERLLAA